MNKFITWIKQHKILSAFLIVLLLGYLWYSPPFKATDPLSPMFSESWFRMRDYASEKGTRELRDKVLPKLFPVGTPKEYVDKILVTYGGARLDDHTNVIEGMYIYRYTPLYLMLTPDSFMIRVYYDQNNKVKSIRFAGEVVNGHGYEPKKIPGGLKATTGAKND